MPYRFVTEKIDYTDYASGRVLYGTPGYPAFPVRLASEIFQACLHHRNQSISTGPCVLYDPVCGGAYHLSVLAYLHWESIRYVIGSDVDFDILTTARKNLGLLTPEGIEKRIDEIKMLAESYGKRSHNDALVSAHELRKRLLHNVADHRIQTTVFHADAMDPQALMDKVGEHTVDVVIADIPYGNRSTWQIADRTISNPISHMLTNLLPIITNSSVVAIAADKRSKVSHPFYQRLERFQIGKRRVVLLSPVPIK